MTIEAIGRMLLTPERGEKVQSVVRTFPFSLINSDRLLENIDNHILETGYLPLIHTYLAVKSPSSKSSANNLSPIGGKMEKDENPVTAGYRELSEEVSVIPIPCSSQEIGQRYSHLSFNYKIKRKEGDKRHDMREVHFMVLPIMNPSTFTPIYTNQETKSKINEIIPLTVYDLSRAMEEGHYKNRPLEGHIVFKKSSDIVINKLNVEKKDHLLRATLNLLFQYEDQFKKELLAKIIRVAKTNGFDFQESSEKFEDQLLKIKEILPAGIFARTLSEAHSNLNEEVSMKYFRLKQIQKIKEQEGKKIKIPTDIGDKEFRSLKIKAEVVKKSLLDWTFGIEYLHYLQIFVKNETSKKSLTTGSIVAFKGLFNKLIDGSIKDSRLSIGKKEKENQQLIVKRFLSNPNINLQRKQDLLREINGHLINNLAHLFEVSPDQIVEAWSEALRFIPDLAEHINKADPALSQIYQYDELRNEISNASLAKTLLMLQSIDIQDHGDDWPVLKFEAGRQLLFFLKILFDKPYYQKEVAKIPNPLSEAVTQFFGQVDHIDELSFSLKIRDKIHNFYMQTYDRKNEKGNVVRIDKKPLKPFISFVRKSFETRANDIKDFYSVNIILPDEDYRDVSPELRIKHISKLFGEFKTFIREQFPQYKLEEIKKDTKNTFGNYFRYKSGIDIPTGGLRTGSQASRIIRAKTYLGLINSKNPEDSYFMEVALYPFESLYDPKKLEKDQIMGWREKIVDDQRYSVRRMLFPLVEGGQSLLELLFPPFLYPNYIRKLKELVLIPD